MNISWKWLLQYVKYTGPREEAVRLLTGAGLNVDSLQELPDGDALLDVEVTSNRPDCLGHIGVARELSALTGAALLIPDAAYTVSSEKAAQLTSVVVDDPVGCPRYTARMIRGVKVGPSPRWLAARLLAVGLRPVNNVVDVTNFVLYEHGQPLHAFDFHKLAERRIVVRRAARGEAFVAIDHSQHRLDETDLVIADAARAVALAGVMGGADSEVNEQATDVLLESAVFDPLSVRNTARARQMMSDASYRFERGVDWDGVDWASRRACRLIQETAGGQIAQGVVDVAQPRPRPHRAVLRFAQVARLLGVQVPRAEVLRILKALGLTVAAETKEAVEVEAPLFRRDLSREADLIEEVARVYGYDQVPYLSQIPTVAPPPNRRETVVQTIQGVLAAAGYQEVITLTVADAETAALFSPDDGGAAPLSTRPTAKTPAIYVRKSVLSGVLQAKHNNQDAGLPEVSLFEIARAFRDAGPERLPHESVRAALATDDGPEALKGAVEAVAERLGLAGRLTLSPAERVRELEPDGQADAQLDGRTVGFFGRLGETTAARFKFRHVPWVAELELEPLIAAAVLVPRFKPVPQLPAIERDLALVVDESVLWRDLEGAIRSAGVGELEQVAFVSLYRGSQVPSGKKCLAVRLRFRGETTLTHEQADEFQARILSALRAALGAELRSSQ